MPSNPDRKSDPQQRIIDEFIALTPGEADAHDLFCHLARATVSESKKLGLHKTVFPFSPGSAGFGLAHVNAVGAEVSEELVHGWKRFADLYQDLIHRNPRLELRDLLQEISERRESASWPHLWEWDIERWISDGAPEGQMRYSVDDDIRDRLLELYPILNGWLYLDETGMVSFAETAAFHQVKVQLDEERKKVIQREQELFADSQPQSELRLADRNAPGSRLVAIEQPPNDDNDPRQP
jgi:hypothetical protein